MAQRIARIMYAPRRSEYTAMDATVQEVRSKEIASVIELQLKRFFTVASRQGL